jgi:putative two-component system response regulator
MPDPTYETARTEVLVDPTLMAPIRAVRQKACSAQAPTRPRRRGSWLFDTAMATELAARVLVVEDDPSIRALVRSILEREGFHPLLIADGETALRAVHEHDPDLVLLDVGLPGMDGLEVTRRLRLDPRFRALPVILLTARITMDDMVAGLDAGADDFIRKPFQRAELLARMRSALRMRRAIVGMETAQAVVATLANAVEAKDLTTGGHCERLAVVVGRFGTQVGLNSAQLEAVAYGALLHDIGKIGIPEAILAKPGPLTEDEWIVMRRHPEIGERICQPLTFSQDLAPIVRHHHERWDGGGYPDGLLAEAAPIGARIVGLADAFDAMTHERPYRPAMSIGSAIDEIRRGLGRQFDPGLGLLFADLLEGQAEAVSAPAAVLDRATTRPSRTVVGDPVRALDRG